MDQFVCVRLIQGNGLDLTLFQFDYDLTFAAFFLNADRTLYGRYGTRSSLKEAEVDMSMPGFREAMTAALKLHREFPSNRESLAGKQALELRFKTPEEYPSLREFKLKLDYEKLEFGGCIHCHQVRDADRRLLRDRGESLSDRDMFPWPMPDLVGLSLDPERRATVKSIAEDSPAARAGLRAGDEILSLAGQPLVSTADVQWVLHNADDGAKLPVRVRRDDRVATLALELPTGWRRAADVSWRPTSWDLRRMSTGGLVLENLTDDERREAGVADDKLALRVKHVGQFGAHAAGRNAGFQKGDIVIEYDGVSKRMTESLLFAHATQVRKLGDRVPIAVLRNGKRLTLTLPMQ
jgi:hypothetical protein